MKTSICTAFSFLALANSVVRAAPYYLVSSFLPEDDSGIYLLEDLNDDGDALDMDEIRLWANGMSSPGDVRRFGPGVLAADPDRGEIVYFVDSNHDGDALDAGESRLWADGFDRIFGVDISPAGVYAADFEADEIYLLQDDNFDGDALDAMEKELWADGIDTPVSVLATSDQLYVVSYGDGAVYQLSDQNMDSDALDMGEVFLYSPLGSISLAEGLYAGTSGELYVGSVLDHAIYRVLDGNGDGDARDPMEVSSYADSVSGNLDDPWNAAPHSSGGFLSVQNDTDEVLLVLDSNGDGDSLDPGEAGLWANALMFPVGIILVPEPSSLVLVAVGLANCTGWTLPWFGGRIPVGSSTGRQL